MNKQNYISLSEGVTALGVIRSSIPFWRRGRLWREFLRVELAIKVKKIWNKEK